MALKKVELSVSLKVDQSGNNDFGNQNFTPEFRRSLAFGPGTTADNADLFFIDHRTIAASGTDAIDLAGQLTDAYGATITGLEIVGIMVTADAANTNNVLVGGGTNPVAGLWGAAGDIIKVPPGGVFLAFGRNAAGLSPVVATTGDILTIANSGAGSTVGYDIALVMRSA